MEIINIEFRDKIKKQKHILYSEYSLESNVNVTTSWSSSRIMAALEVDIQSEVMRLFSQQIANELDGIFTNGDRDGNN